MYSLKYQFFRLRFSLLLSGRKRSEWVMNKNIFKSVGENIGFQPRVLPADPELIVLHNNISIASGVTFITHDVFHLVLNNLNNGVKYQRNMGCIEIMDNVTIGSNTIILPNTRIGPNAIIGAGSVVTKDVPSGTIVAGNPARIIGSFDNYTNKRSKDSNNRSYNDQVEEVWKRFHEERNRSVK